MMHDILHEHGVELRVGLVNKDDAAYEAEAASEIRFSDRNGSDGSTDGDESVSG